MLIITIGSRGDVQPYLALAIELIKVDWSVCIATHKNFKSFIEEMV